jgi:hypothetical protein
MTNFKTTCHRDGTVTYWSVYDQTWKRHEYCIPDRELAAMSETERRRVMRHLGIAD